jgi:hypothetical protein
MYCFVCGIEEGDEDVALGDPDDVGRGALRTLDLREVVALLLLVHPALDARLVHPLRRAATSATTNTSVLLSLHCEK